MTLEPNYVLVTVIHYDIDASVFEGVKDFTYYFRFICYVENFD